MMLNVHRNRKAYYSHTGVKVPKTDIPGQSDLCLVLFLKKVKDSSQNKSVSKHDA